VSRYGKSENEFDNGRDEVQCLMTPMESKNT